MQANFQFNPTQTANPFFSTTPFGAFSNTQFFLPPSVQPNFQSAELGQILGSILQALEQLSQGFHAVVGPQANPAAAQNQSAQVENGPAQPATSSAPTQPTTSSAPTQPATSSASTEPATSSAPTQPATPSTSATPNSGGTSIINETPNSGGIPTDPGNSATSLNSKVEAVLAQMGDLSSKPGVTRQDFGQLFQSLPPDVAEHTLAVYYLFTGGRQLPGGGDQSVAGDPAQGLQQFINDMNTPVNTVTGFTKPESMPWIATLAAEAGFSPTTGANLVTGAGPEGMS